MSKLFSGLKFILVGATSKQRQAISASILKEGGLVLSPPILPSSLSTSSSAVSTSATEFDISSRGDMGLLRECTHMLLAEYKLKRVSPTQLCRLLGCTAEELGGAVLTQQVPLVQVDWVTECIARGQVVVPDAFRVHVDDAATNPNPPVVETLSTESDTKKRKINEFFKPASVKSTVEATAASAASATTGSVSQGTPSPQKLKLTVPKRPTTGTLSTASVPVEGTKATSISLGTSLLGQPCHLPAFGVQFEHSHVPLLTESTIAATRSVALRSSTTTTTEAEVTAQWEEIDSVLFRLQPLSALHRSGTSAEPVLEYVGFDMDDTVICTKSGKVFATDEHDWRFWSDKVRPAIRRLVLEEGKCVVLLSNQGGVAKGKVSKPQLQRKVEAMINSLGVPVDFLCALGDDLARKPLTGMWDLLNYYRALQLHSESPNTRNVRLSLYVGDAAGRPAAGTRKKDFSDSDLKLAFNLNAGFNTPEEFFLGASPRSSHLCLSGTPLVSSIPGARAGTLAEWEARLVPALTPCTGAAEIVLLVGVPASGKSTLARLLERQLGHDRVNRDALGTAEKCLRAARQALTGSGNSSSSGGASGGGASSASKGPRSVVVDNTNVDADSRAPWLALAKELSIPIRCVFLDTPKDVAKALLKLRDMSPDTLHEDRRPVPSFVLESLFKKLQPPQVEEGFDRVDVLPFRIDTFSEKYSTLSPITKRLYECFL